ncbi:acyl-CoA N-acyltransferase [Jackrogersella minutella]|nr:acyl-CoA N-acyltransferase [Jackrogersella minutella]
MEDEWTVDANEAITVSLVHPAPPGTEAVERFKPKFTYPIYGENERIFGYKGLKINLRFDARDLRPNLSVSSSRKFTSIGEVEALDIKNTMMEFLPGVAFQSKKDYDRAVNGLPDTWTPPGTLIKTIEKDGDTYEIWHGTLAEPATHQLMKRIQIAVLFYIEGGSFIVNLEGDDEPESALARWSVFWVYKINPKGGNKLNYTFQGFATTYKFWSFQPPTPPASPGTQMVDDSWELPEEDLQYELTHRVRISQFLILPPFQGKGLGSMLYNTIFEIAMKTPMTKEVTVEDPNEDFDLLRDLCDIKYLRSNVPEFAQLKVNNTIPIPMKGGLLYHSTHIAPDGVSLKTNGAIVDIEQLEKLRIKNKIAPRQFWRLVEMHLMSKLPASVRPRSDPETEKPTASESEKHAYTLWRLLLKQRLYRRNVSILGEFEITERIIRLNETLDNVEWEYARILDHLEPKPAVGDTSISAIGKRRLDEDVDMDSPASKKARVSDA